MDGKLAAVMQKIEEIHRQDNVENRFGTIKQTMFTGRSTPKLKGKAGEIKDLGPVLLKVFQRHMNPKLELHRKIEFMLRMSSHLDKILDDHPTEFVLPESAAQDLIATGFTYLAVWAEVATAFKDEEHVLFGFTAKAHIPMHCCLLSRSPH